LKQRIVREFGINCYDPPNGTSVKIATKKTLPINVSAGLLKRQFQQSRYPESAEEGDSSYTEEDGSMDVTTEAVASYGKRVCGPIDKIPIQGMLVMKDNQVQSSNEHDSNFTTLTCCPI